MIHGKASFTDQRFTRLEQKVDLLLSKIEPITQEKLRVNYELSSYETMAPGVGFEPTRPLRVTDLAGLRPTRLGDPGAENITVAFP